MLWGMASPAGASVRAPSAGGLGKGSRLCPAVLGVSTVRRPARFPHSLTHSLNPGCATRHLVPSPQGKFPAAAGKSHQECNPIPKSLLSPPAAARLPLKNPSSHLPFVPLQPRPTRSRARRASLLPCRAAP